MFQLKVFRFCRYRQQPPQSSQSTGQERERERETCELRWAVLKRKHSFSTCIEIFLFYFFSLLSFLLHWDEVRAVEREEEAEKEKQKQIRECMANDHRNIEQWRSIQILYRRFVYFRHFSALSAVWHSHSSFRHFMGFWCNFKIDTHIQTHIRKASAVIKFFFSCMLIVQKRVELTFPSVFFFFGFQIYSTVHQQNKTHTAHHKLEFSTKICVKWFLLLL